MSDLVVEKVDKKPMTRVEGIILFIAFLFFTSIVSLFVYSVRATKEREQLGRESEERRLNSFDVDVAIAVAEKINTHESFGRSSIHPQQLVDFQVRELEAMVAGIGKGSWEDPYFRLMIHGKLPDRNTEVEKWNPPFFVIGGKLIHVRVQANCAKSSRSIHFPRTWTLQNPDMVLIRVRREADTMVKSEEELSQLLGTSSENIKALEVWKKTCKWTVSPPSAR